MISTISVMTLRYAIVLLQCDVLICCLVLVLWHYAITFDYFAFAMCWFVTVPWRFFILCYFAVAFSYSSISTLGKAVLLLWFVIFIACVSLWCFVKVTCSSAWHSETSFGQDKLFPAKIIIMLICFRVLENFRNLFQLYTWLQINMAPVSGHPPELTKWVLDFFIAGISLNDSAEQERLPSPRYVSNHFLFDTSVFSLAWYFIAPLWDTRLTIASSKELRFNSLAFTIFIIQSQVGAIPVVSRLCRRVMWTHYYTKMVR